MFVPAASGRGRPYHEDTLPLEVPLSELDKRGMVRGSGGRFYHASVYFDPGPGHALRFDNGECSCPVGTDCKHTVALALAAADGAGHTVDARPRQPSAGWERSLTSLFEPTDPRAADTPAGAPLAIELTTAATAGGRASAPRLLARVVRPGTSGWVGGGMSWSGLASLHHHGHRDSHLRLLRELYALSQAGTGPSTFHTYRDDKTIDLAAFESRQLWSMLEEAESIGLRLVHARKGLGALDPPGDAELFLDITTGQHAGSSVLAPALRVEGTDDARVPVGFIGAQGHGVVHVAAAQAGAEPAAWRLALARLARPVPPMLQRMALSGQRLEIPAGERERFRDEFYPRLRHRAPIVSSDGSFTPPAISEPTLVVHAAYGDGHDLAVRWEWAYQVGQARMRAPLGGPGSDEGYRDPGQERALLETLPAPRDGFGWLAFLWASRLGGILADDMGLGKTLQTLALICHAKQADPTLAPFLIVAPTSVVTNWSGEAVRFAPGLRVAAVQDTLRRRGQGLDEVIAGADVVVTSYTLFRLDFAAYAEADWSGLVLDEAQHTKNHQSKIDQCVRRLRAPFKLAITGTPMENNLMELWSLLSITAPGLFPNPKRFREHYAQPIEKHADAERLTQFRRRIKPLVKRRTKELVAADLPAKQEQVVEVELAPRHRRTYQRHLQRERQKVMGLIDDLNRNRFTILRSLTLLRQLSLHAGLVDGADDDLPSGKIEALLDQLGEVVDGGHRALVFSQFTGFLARVRERLDEAGIAYCYLDGSTRRRDAVVRGFKDGAAPVFLISLKAGGFGLNLTEADYCFLLDPWWNPATEAQAVDRAHRIGQSRNVMVYRLIAKDTIEEKVLALQNRKAALFSGVMDDGNMFGSSLDAEEIRELLA